MEYWSIGVMEYWKEEKTLAKASASVATLTSADKAAWQGRQNEKHWNIGIMECWKNGKEKKTGYKNQEQWNDGVMCENRDSTLQILWVSFDLIGHKPYAGVMT